MHVTPLNNLDGGLLAQHLDRNARHSELEDIQYSIFEAKDLPSVSQLECDIRSGIAREIGEVSWARFWVIKTSHNKITGHLYLKGSPYPSSKHRCRLGMGIEPNYRGKGFGKKLIGEALKWLKSCTDLDWVELFAFEHNLPAIRLYEKIGFSKVGLVEDIFRVNGQSVNDVIMTLRIR